MRQIRLMVAALLLISPFAANADLISGVTGTGGTVIDAVNNQEWLRLDVTVGQSVADALALSAADGFIWASEDALNNLLDQFFGIYGGDPGSRAGDYLSADTTAGALAQWNSLFGLTFDSIGPTESLGFYDDGVSDWGLLSYYGFAGGSPEASNGFQVEPYFDVGVFLVRDVAEVPEPGTLALLGLGLAGMGLSRRRKKI